MTKTIEAWFEELPEPWRTQALTNRGNVAEHPYKSVQTADCLYSALHKGFGWAHSIEKHKYWFDISVAVNTALIDHVLFAPLLSKNLDALSKSIYKPTNSIMEPNDIFKGSESPRVAPPKPAFPKGGTCPIPDAAVARPAHYTQGDIECIDAMASACVGLEGMEAVCTSNALKYLWRWKYKNGTQDLEKAKWYIDRLIAFNTKS